MRIRTKYLRRLLATSAQMSVLLPALLLAGPALAQNKDAPIWLRADNITTDDKSNSLTAVGNVEFSQNGETVQADTVIYDRANEVVIAKGNVKMWQKTGEVLFANYAELSRDMRQGFIDQIAILLSDNSRAIGTAGERTEGRYTRIDKGLYTACAPCAKNRAKPPLWQVRADRVIHDSEKKDVIYRNASLELAGVPIFYTPYLSHPDPSVTRRSGFLAPVIGSKPSLGFTARTYYYLDIAPSMDATIETSYSAESGPLVGGEFRQRFANGALKINASVSPDDITDDIDSTQKDSGLRGHFFLDSSFDLSKNWRASINVKRTSDDSYLELWNYTDDDVLPSSAQLEHFTERSYGQVEMLSYQDLRSNTVSPEPQVLLAMWQAQGTPNDTMGGRWSLSAGSRNIVRTRGQDSNRTSFAAGWRREDILPAGLVLTNEANTRVDAFWANNLNDTNEDVTAARPFAQYQGTLRWPLAKMGETGQTFIEPIAQITLAPRQKRDDDDLPIEDAQGLEFDTTNLFMPNRYPGADRVDGGQRVAYGVRTGWAGNSGASVTAALGQSYDFASTPNFTTGSGLEESRSDIVGNVSAALPQIVDLSYSFRLDQETMDPREHDISAVVGPSWLQAATSYIYIDQPTDAGIPQVREELSVAGQWKFSDYWSIAASHSRDLQRSNGALDTAITLTYTDECLTFALIGERDHVARTGLETGDSIFFRLIFKNIGEFESPAFAPNFIGSDESN